MFVPTTAFGLRDLTISEITSIYSEKIACSLDTDFVSQPAYADFRAFDVDGIRLIYLSVSERVTTRSTEHIQADQFDGICFLYTVSGAAIIRTEYAEAVSEAGDLVVLDMSQPFTIVDQEDRVLIGLTLPRGRLYDYGIVGSSLHGLSIRNETVTGLANECAKIAPQLERLPSSWSVILAATLMGCVKIVIECCIPDRVRQDKPESNARLRHALSIISSNLHSNQMSPAYLAARLGMSRSQLYEMFRAEGGVAKVIWRQRLQAARKALSDRHDERRIGEIGYAFGFNSEPHFTRAFRQAFGTAPRTYRTTTR